MTKIKRVLRKGLRLLARFLRKLDRKIQRAFTKFFRGIYKIKFFRPLAKKIYPFFHYHHRIAAAGLCFLFIAGIAIPALQPYMRSQRYELNSQTKELLGEADKDLTNKLTFDDKNQLFQFNKDAKKEPTTEGNPLANLKSQVGGASEKDEQLYSVDVSKDLSKGVTYYDNQMQLSFKLMPQFSTMPGEQKDGHLVYPLNGTKGQLAYTVGAGGMKENVVLYKSPGNEFSMSYKLDLPKSLEAKLIPETGEVGIYSADPALFGNISYGSSNDQSLVENARNASEKSFLTFKIPAPVVLGLGKSDQKSVAPIESYFELSGDTLRVVTKGLDKAEYPLSIDPSVTVDSNSDFQAGNFEDKNLSIDSGDLKRGGLTGGDLNSPWSNGTNFPVSIAYHEVVAYNGYLYVFGGWDGDNTIDDVRLAAINSNGTIGSWGYTTDIAGTRSDLRAFAYNGYMYILGGRDNSNVLHNDVQYATINPSNGQLGGWTPTESFATPRWGHGVAVYNGYAYVSGGHFTNSDNSNYLGDVQYAPIKANGEIGSWTTNPVALEGAIAEHSMVAYNNFMYRIGGDWTDTVSYAPINTNGSLGSWAFTTSLPAVRYSHATAIYNGYIYVSGGNGYMNTTIYTPITGSGKLGAWQSTNNLPSGRSHTYAAVYNGYFYIVGGDTSGGPTNQVRYAAINAAGMTTGYTTINNFGTGRERHAAVAYNGYLYVIGGRKGSSSTACRSSGTGSGTSCNDTRYAPLNENGSVGTWNDTTYFTTARYGHAAFAYNGYMYVLGGDTGSRTNNVQKATINHSNGTLSSWTNVTSFSTARYLHTAVAYNGYAYVIGGNASGGDTTSVEYAPLNADGSITSGAWQSATALPAARAYHTSAVYAGYIYVIGGNNGGYLNTVYYAPLTSSGAIGVAGWQTTATLGTARDSAAAVAYNGYLYVTGGTSTGGSQIATAEYAQIKSDGSLEPWQPIASIPAARSSHAAVVDNGRLYVLGGFGSGYNNTVYFSTINNGGQATANSWSQASNSYTTARERIGTAVYNGYIYMMGGLKASGASNADCRSPDIGSGLRCNDVQYASIGSNGNLGAWQSTSSFTTARERHEVVAYNGYLYIMGGYDGTNALNNIQYAQINAANGSVGTWQSTNAFPTARFYFGAVAYNGYMYVMGGDKGTSNASCRSSGSGALCNDIQYATIQSDGTIANNWTSVGSTFTGPRSELGAVAYNGYMYMVGGYDGSSALMDVQYAQINSNGTITSWQPTTYMRYGRATPEPVVYNGYLYVAGGFHETSAFTLGTLDSVHFAPINANGTLGAWDITVGHPGGRYYHGTEIYNGYMYVIGGYGGGVRNDIQYAALNVIPRKATYSKTIDLGTNSKITGITYSGTVPGDTKSIKYRMAGADGLFGSSKSAVAPLVCTDSIGQYIQLFVTLDDAETGRFADVLNANNAKASSITVNSSPVSPPPQQRLRHGAWFSNEVLQPFDTGGNVCS